MLYYFSCTLAVLNDACNDKAMMKALLIRQPGTERWVVFLISSGKAIKLCTNR